MLEILLVLHLIVTISLVGIILLQKTSSDGLGGLGGGSNNVFSGKATANFLTKTTTILAIIFLVNSLLMAAITSSNNKSSIIEDIKEEQGVPLAK